MIMQQRMIYQVEETREKILQVAEELFLEQGFFDTQMKDVAVQMGMSRHTLYRYFRDKADLGYTILGKIFAKLIVQIEEELERYLAHKTESGASASAREQLINCLEGSFTNPKNQTDLRFMAEFDAFYSGRRIPEDFVDKITIDYDRFLELVEKLLRRGIEEGSIRNDIDPWALFNTCAYSMKILQQMMIGRGGALLGLSEESEQQLMQTLVQLLMDGLKPQSEVSGSGSEKA